MASNKGILNEQIALTTSLINSLLVYKTISNKRFIARVKKYKRQNISIVISPSMIAKLCWEKKQDVIIFLLNNDKTLIENNINKLFYDVCLFGCDDVVKYLCLILEKDKKDLIVGEFNNKVQHLLLHNFDKCYTNPNDNPRIEPLVKTIRILMQFIDESEKKKRFPFNHESYIREGEQTFSPQIVEELEKLGIEFL
jgi:hypothetical protein